MDSKERKTDINYLSKYNNGNVNSEDGIKNSKTNKESI